ncbi:hypothetical protein Pmar_PMAR028972 [Perkinsus marinus ATCC 50983]|uniref:Uncharacterized protein n=1 Tax=Perkinsus marinus (strain ATCC 50983 / TXsc) TaxID=423536 RepID=C5KIG7_PERM5|nr:hypothetical protein Pmar_PMAR028972 [Perkinsus marinus ATCC 50983]EER15728.1 hypothetical protein Pmar_PMAR028972 [Perkinsus marinus ATCC 50983]|eukprot:XP_002783932.1 hypothetical protein Pmar_PMAR028972 [Perkinsus marinus ATCC 50983]
MANSKVPSYKKIVEPMDERIRKLEEAYLVESRATYDALKALLQHPASLQRDPRAAGEGCLTGVLPLHADEPIEESQRIFSAVIGYKQAKGDEDGDT